MNVHSIRKEEIFHMIVDDEEYHRHSSDHWTKTMSFDIHSEDYRVSDDSQKKLEAAFQAHKELI